MAVQYVREEWTLFRTLPTLCQKAGVSPEDLRRVVVKELADNALDASDAVTFEFENGWYLIQDDGPGIDGTPEEIAALYSLNRPLTSSKLERLPTRGALGNGLRVVVGAVYVSRGRLTVCTRNQRLHLTPQEDGTTAVHVEPATFPTGTRVEVWLGPDIPDDPNCLRDAHFAALMANGQAHYSGKTSPHWYDANTFFNLLDAYGDRPLRSFVADRLDGCSGAKAGQICAPFKGRSASSLTRDEAAALLQAAQTASTPVKPERLGHVGPRESLGRSYARGYWSLPVAGIVVPCVMEVWAEPVEQDTAFIFVNRTPVNGDGAYFRSDGNKAERNLWAYGLDEHIRTGRDRPGRRHRARRT